MRRSVVHQLVRLKICQWHVLLQFLVLRDVIGLTLLYPVSR
jgi:hypothetical protein